MRRLGPGVETPTSGDPWPPGTAGAVGEPLEGGTGTQLPLFAVGTTGKGRHVLNGSPGMRGRKPAVVVTIDEDGVRLVPRRSRRWSLVLAAALAGWNLFWLVRLVKDWSRAKRGP